MYEAETSGHKGFIPDGHSGKSLITYYLSTAKVVVFLMAYRDAQGIIVIWTEHTNQLKEGFFFSKFTSERNSAAGALGYFAKLCV